jgi:hypothetical protein
MKALFTPTGAGPVADVEVGMPVVDAAGSELGFVRDVSIGDSDAVTTEGNELRALGGWLARYLSVVSSDVSLEPRVREPLRTRLMRIGFIKVVGHGPMARSHYVRADRIARVHDGRVDLSVSVDDVDTER